MATSAQPPELRDIASQHQFAPRAKGIVCYWQKGGALYLSIFYNDDIKLMDYARWSGDVRSTLPPEPPVDAQSYTDDQEDGGAGATADQVLMQRHM
jgi:hypothetical protein